MSKLVRFLLAAGRIFDRGGDWLVGVAAVLLFAMGILINVEVFGRYLFNYSTLISDEYSGYFFTWMTLLCFFFALRTGRFLQVEAVVQKLPRWMHNLIAIPAALTGLIVSGIMAHATYSMWDVNWLFGSVSLQPSQTPLWIPQIIMPIGFGMLALGYLERLMTAIFRLTGHLDQDQGVRI